MKSFSLLFLALLVIFNSAKAEWKPGEPLTDTRDGQIYKTVVIGNQVWMAENMNIGTLILSTSGGRLMKDDGIIEKYCWEDVLVNCNGEDGKIKRGGFYEWEEAVQYWSGQPTLPVQGICPEGWHIPSVDEWDELLGYLGGSDAPQKMKVGGGSGFDAIMTGYRCTATGTHRISAMDSDMRTYYWSAEQDDASNSLFYEIGENSLVSMAFYKSLGLCVRCLWNGTAQSIKPSEEFGDLVSMSANPNPIGESTNLTFMLNSDKPEYIELFVVDISGKICMRLVDGIVPNGKNSILLDGKTLSSGKYFVICKIGDYMQNLPLFVTR